MWFAMLTHPTCADLINFGGWQSERVSRSEPDGSTWQVTIEPGMNGYEFLPRKHAERRALILFDAQHE